MATLAEARAAVGVAAQKQSALRSRLPMLTGPTETSARTKFGDGTTRLNVANSAVGKNNDTAYSSATAAANAFDAGLAAANIRTSDMPPGTYVVVRGDTLSKIGTRFGTTAQVLYDLNKAVIGPNPNIIEVGMALRLPAQAAAPATRRRAMAKSAATPPPMPPPGIPEATPPPMEEFKPTPAWVRPAAMAVGVVAAAGAAYLIYTSIFGGKSQAA